MLCALAGMLAASGCSMSSKLNVQDSAVISSANFKIIRPISREVTATYVFGIGGFSAREKKEQAVLSMMKELKENQALAYITVNESHIVGFPMIVHQSRTRITAVVIEYEK